MSGDTLQLIMGLALVVALTGIGIAQGLTYLVINPGHFDPQLSMAGVTILTLLQGYRHLLDMVFKRNGVSNGTEPK